MMPLTIGRAARAVGIGVETIRFYERKGLIARPQQPADGGARDYGGETLTRLRFIGQAKEIGFSLAEIAALLSLQADAGAGCEDVRARAMAKRAQFDIKLEQLTCMRNALDALITQCPGTGDMSSCAILDAMTFGPIQPRG